MKHLLKQVVYINAEHMNIDKFNPAIQQTKTFYNNL